ncbi:hypothetical protein MPH_13658 [Macrophomina phaseolina MS6]|uniref:Uncharacterized protein n=1 Tax=Macrophomina phaseolina (strain MS6) TaxID=1126212 RepID=K2RGW4_MACPH|nr:hypothetical protein MPH_13658 [Macrophomina phaseolina MS6]
MMTKAMTKFSQAFSFPFDSLFDALCIRRKQSCVLRSSSITRIAFLWRTSLLSLRGRTLRSLRLFLVLLRSNTYVLWLFLVCDGLTISCLRPTKAGPWIRSMRS